MLMAMACHRLLLLLLVSRTRHTSDRYGPGPYVFLHAIHIVFAHLVDLFKHHLELDLTFALQYNL